MVISQLYEFHRYKNVTSIYTMNQTGGNLWIVWTKGLRWGYNIVILSNSPLLAGDIHNAQGEWTSSVCTADVSTPTHFTDIYHMQSMKQLLVWASFSLLCLSWVCLERLVICLHLMSFATVSWVRSMDQHALDMDCLWTPAAALSLKDSNLWLPIYSIKV